MPGTPALTQQADLPARLSAGRLGVRCWGYSEHAGDGLETSFVTQRSQLFDFVYPAFPCRDKSSPVRWVGEARALGIAR